MVAGSARSACANVDEGASAVASASGGWERRLGWVVSFLRGLQLALPDATSRGAWLRCFGPPRGYVDVALKCTRLCSDVLDPLLRRPVSNLPCTGMGIWVSFLHRDVEGEPPEIGKELGPPPLFLGVKQLQWRSRAMVNHAGQVPQAPPSVDVS